MVHRRKPAGRPKSVMTENLDIGGMHNEWDGCEAIRTRLRNGEDLLVGKINEDIPSLVANIEILQPLITRMSLTATRPLPAVDALRDEVEATYIANKRGQTPEDQPDVVATSWKIRKLLVFLKMKVRRHEVSTVPSLRYMGWVCIQ